MHMKAIIAGMLAPTIILASPASAASVMDPVGDFLPTYTAGPPLADLDVTSFSINYNSMMQFFTLGATFAGDINPQTGGLYVIGVNTGTGVLRPFGALGQPNVIFNQAIVLRKDGTGGIGPTVLDPAGISIAGNILTARIPLSLLPSTGYSPTQYGFNLWPRLGLGNANQITDFAPQNANISISAVPEPTTWGMMLMGLGLAGMRLRSRPNKVAVRIAYD